MMTLSIIFLVVLFLLLVGVAAVRPLHSTMSAFELERRANAGDTGAATTLHREVLLGDVVVLQRILVALLLVFFVVWSVSVFGWVIGVIIAVVVALEYSAVAKITLITRPAQRLYDKIEPWLLRVIDKIQPVFRIFGRDDTSLSDAELHSREELIHMMTSSHNILSADEKKLVTHGLSFSDTAIKDIMTPRSMIDSIGKDELLGPLLLDELHKTNHSRIPVTDGDIDHVVGMLYINQLLSLQKKKSLTAGKAMDPAVYYIHEDQTAAHALTAFIKTHHHLFIVVNEYRETVGVVSLEDVIEQLLGREIIDEFDSHDDLRAVAERNPRGNNRPKNQHDI